MRVDDLFRAAGLEPCGPTPWRIGIEEPRRGVYVVVLKQKQRDCPLCPTATAKLSEAARELETTRWVPEEKIIYVGQTTRQTIATRVRQFYRHKYGDSSPHRGGQAVHLLSCELEVYWSHSDDPENSESQMLLAFIEESG